MANWDKAVTSRRPIAPMRHPGSFETEPGLGVLSIESTRQLGWMRAHVGDTLVVRRTTRACDASTGATKIPGNYGKIDASCSYLGRISIVVVTGAGQLVMGDGLVDHGCRVLDFRRRTSPTGCVENRSLPNQISSDAGD